MSLCFHTRSLPGKLSPTVHPVGLLRELSDPMWLGFESLLHPSLEPHASPAIMGQVKGMCLGINASFGTT